MNLKKCKFCINEVEFLRFLVSHEGIKMDPAKVDTIQSWPEPQNIKEIQIFLSFANFYWRFITHYSQIAVPLTKYFKTTGKKKARPGQTFLDQNTVTVFNQLKQIFQKASFFTHFDSKTHICLETDALIIALIRILSQKLPADSMSMQWQPVTFYSRKFSPVKFKYKTHDQKLLTIVQCFKTWCHFLKGSVHPVLVFTDHNNLRYFQITKSLTRH